MRCRFWILAVLCLVPRPGRADSEALPEESFKDVEVRVIRQKYFQKSKRVELGAAAHGVMNKAFVYDVQGSASVGFHLNEEIGIFGEGGAGQTFKKNDCDLLGEKYHIEPMVDVLKSWYGIGLALTPGYGKYQLSDGSVQYVDWFVNVGLGMAHSVARSHGVCIRGEAAAESARDSFQASVAAGQRYFLGPDAAVVWNVRYMQVESGEGFIDGFSNVFLSLGLSYFL